jgi:hypothetical protein
LKISVPTASVPFSLEFIKPRKKRKNKNRRLW